MDTKELDKLINAWINDLRNSEKSDNTISNYQNGIKKFSYFLQESGTGEITKSEILEYKKNLKEQGLKTATINSRLTVLNKFLKDNDLNGLTVKLEKVQVKNSLDNMLNDSDYKRLIRWSDKLGMEREKLIMEALSGTGARISELSYFTVENLKNTKDKITVRNKGKERTIVLPDKVRRNLLDYAKRQGIETGIIFHARNNPDKLLDKAQIWRNLKKIAGQARVKKSKVHAHSFRHLFAKRYLDTPQADILTLADLLGHSSLETTRRYTRKTSKEQKIIVNKLFNQYEN